MAVKNDPKVIAKTLRAMAGGTDHVATGQDIILKAAADLLDPPAHPDGPLFYTKGDDRIYQRPVKTERGVQMGFAVCKVYDGIDPAEVCAILNRGEPATE
jgi:hypothetical protein